MKQRSIVHVHATRPTIEGAGVHLHRAFGYEEKGQYDPFLLLDDFGSENPHDYIMGFPWHPHRGIETVTYVLSGEVDHEDSMGNQGAIQRGDIQWMTAGSGIIHQEMPQQFKGRLRGFQLWVNLPAKDKMMPPRYQEIQKEAVPIHQEENGVHVKVICGNYKGKQGPVKDLMVDVEYLDIEMPAGKRFHHVVSQEKTVFAYLYEGSAQFEGGKTELSGEQVIRFGQGTELEIQTTHQSAKLLLISGTPLKEPIAWGGPIVMNTQAELEHAFQELQEDTFVKVKAQG